MHPRIDIITIGVADLARARRFFQDGFGCEVREEAETLTLSLGPHASTLAVRPWDAVARRAWRRAGRG